MPDDVVAFIDFLGRQWGKLSNRWRKRRAPLRPDEPSE
jgi:hypothetical protein